MGNGISQEQLESHLQKQEALIRQLQAVVEQQAASLQAMGHAAVDYAVEGHSEKPMPSELHDEVTGLRRANVTNRRNESEVTDEERQAGRQEWTEPTEEEERGFQATKPWLGAMAPPTGFEYGKTDGLPDVKLELEHVYGYRANAVRQNVIWIDTKTILYFTAAVGIVHNIETNTQKFFRSHSDDILSIAYHPQRRIVATGEKGKFPSVHVWDVDTCQELAKIAGFHTRAVVSVAFSADGSRVASVGLDDQHSVAVHDWQSGNMIAAAPGDTERILDIQFNGTSSADGNRDFVTCGVKHIKFWSIENGALRSEKGLIGNLGERQAYLGATFTTKFTALGTQGGEVYLFQANKLVKVLPAHNQSVFALKAVGDTIYTGGKDGFVNRWNANTLASLGTAANLNKAEDPAVLKYATNHVRAIDILGDEAIVGTLTGSIFRIKFPAATVTNVIRTHYGDLSAESQHGELWGLTAAPSGQKFASAGEDATLRVWDANTRKLALMVQLTSKAQCVTWSPDSQWIAVGLHSGAISFIHAETGDEVKSVTKSRRRIQSIRFSPSGNLVAAGSADNVVHIFDAENDFQYKGKLGGHSSVILKVDFSVDEKYLQTCSQSYELIFYDLAKMEQYTRSRELKDVKWATFTSILGWDVQGIWPEFSDGSDVNSVARSNGGNLLATAEDTGLVKVFNYPCVGGGLDRQGRLLARPQSVRAAGHSEHVTEVAWTQGDKRLLSSGGADLSIFQWKVVRA